MNKITIFTPTYNRKELLKECYKSLKKQKDQKFEWLIIDDGSTDETSSLIDNFKKEAKFKINYYYKENGGKHTAQNLALEKCNTKYFLILDSDDILSENAILILNKKIQEIDNDDEISGIIGNKAFKNGKIIGKKMPKVNKLSGLELYQKHKFNGETLRLYKTEIIKKYPYPVIKNEKFMAENIVFDKIDTKYKMKVIEEILYFCEYQENGYSNNINKIKHNNPIGYSYSLKSAAETAIILNKKINWTILYIIWCKRFRIKGFKTFKNKKIYILVYPIATVFNIIKFPKFLFKSIDLR